MTDDVDKSVKRSSEIFRGFNGQTDGRTDTGPWLVGYRGCIASLGRKKMYSLCYLLQFSAHFRSVRCIVGRGRKTYTS